MPFDTILVNYAHPTGSDAACSVFLTQFGRSFGLTTRLRLTVCGRDQFLRNEQKQWEDECVNGCGG